MGYHTQKGTSKQQLAKAMMTPSEEKTVYQKAAHYCSYQERTEKEVREKLCTLGVESEVGINKIIQALKGECFLDEERYVAAFVRGKFFIKKWGKRKIRAALAKKELDQGLIQKGLEEIQDVDYRQTLYELAVQKQRQLARQHLSQDQQKLSNYLLQKGYEPDIVYQVVQRLLKERTF
jgi:regulatory protein